MSSIKISPSILSADFSKLGLEISSLEKAGADLIHIDVMDGHFVPNITIGPDIIKSLRKFSKLPFDVHLMINPVDKYIESFSNAGADIITLHPEATPDLVASIQKIKSLRALIDNTKSDIRLEVDGGVKIDNISKIAKAGADTFVAGSAIFGSDDYFKTITAMRSQIELGLK